MKTEPSVTGSEIVPGGLKLILLDQNAISLLALNPDKIWAEILELLLCGIGTGNILCPTPVESITESMRLPSADRRRIEALCNELSNGYFVKFFWELIAQEILATVRPNVDRFPLWIPKHRREITEHENGGYLRKFLEEKISLETDVNSVERPPKTPDFTLQEATRLWIQSWFGLMRSHLNKFRNGQMIGDDQFVIQQVLATLSEMNITDREIAGLLDGIKTGRWLEIPLLLSWFLMDGLLLYDSLQRGRKYKGNDEWDKIRAATAVHLAHCFITDRGVAGMLRQTKFEIPNCLAVFSVAETNKIVSYLKEICHADS